MTMTLATAPAPTSIDGSPLPVYAAGQMVQALAAYRELQTALDRAMPDQIMELDGRPFRKKGYWRAIAVAFNLTLEPIAERREASGTFEDGRENFGYVVTYRAVAPNGRYTTGDGVCFAVEKARRFRCLHPHPSWPGKTLHFPHNTCPAFDAGFQWRTLPGEATEHNIRSHAHTRAFNRAVSNLVGFGEVSAEEVHRSDTVEHVDVTPAPTPAVDALPAGAMETVTIRVLGIVKRPLANGKEKYVISGSDQHTYATFRLEYATAAKAAQEAGAPIEITYKTTKYGRDIASLRELAEEPVL